MVLVSIKNRLSIANKQRLISMVFIVDSYEQFCRIFLLCLLYNRCELRRFAYRIIYHRLATQGKFIRTGKERFHPALKPHTSKSVPNTAT
jgi:hypothetical protein